jgi:hypothetical protein
MVSCVNIVELKGYFLICSRLVVPIIGEFQKTFLSLLDKLKDLCNKSWGMIIT